jgi:MoaA/NifB/PqqE/SkfB family radical SAM enzyme
MITQHIDPTLRPNPWTAPFMKDPFVEHLYSTPASALTCKHCRAKDQTRGDPRELRTRGAERVVEDLVRLATLILVHAGGDPMACPDILKIIACANRSALGVALSSAATEQLISSDFHAIRAVDLERMSLNLDRFTKQTHDAFRRVSWTFDRMIRTMKMAEGAGILIQINTTLTNQDLHEFSAFRDLMFEWKPAMRSVFILVPTSHAATAADMPECEALEPDFEKRADILGETPFDIKTTEGHHFRRVRCICFSPCR